MYSNTIQARIEATLKELYNKYLIPYWQDSIQIQDTWKKIDNIPNIVATIVLFFMTIKFIIISPL